jgi:hypothetical protein
MPAKKCIPKGSLSGHTAHGIDIAGRPVIFDKGVTGINLLQSSNHSYKLYPEFKDNEQPN